MTDRKRLKFTITTDLAAVERDDLLHFGEELAEATRNLLIAIERCAKRPDNAFPAPATNVFCTGARGGFDEIQARDALRSWDDLMEARYRESPDV